MSRGNSQPSYSNDRHGRYSPAFCQEGDSQDRLSPEGQSRNGGFDQDTNAPYQHPQTQRSRGQRHSGMSRGNSQPSYSNDRHGRYSPAFCQEGDSQDRLSPEGQSRNGGFDQDTNAPYQHPQTQRSRGQRFSRTSRGNNYQPRDHQPRASGAHRNDRGQNLPGNSSSPLSQASTRQDPDPAVEI
eukprot:gnl/Spiro4/22540_TR11114_c0_g1_i1.p2 gnl/Spiro4/22540_TR11114_c0_g1~~gnl/Spiro4/22540_TR11114_c0_g1_i1.p2  ORF type:complete len:206 (-),score=2.87 gnl/Spiro4/22540_TR11114_c0_g1_i1:130-681(-)